MTPSARLARVLLYSHDTYGLGHLRRNLVIAAELLHGSRPPQVVLASGSPVLDQVPRPAGLVCVQLPPVVKTGDDEYRAVDPTMSLSLVRRARTAVLLDVVRRWTPDVLLVDHAPQGMKGELLPVFDELPDISPRTKVVLGMRDILDEPARVQQAWRDAGVYETLASVYDRILVYGDRAVFDIAREYRIPSSTAGRLDYCGYVTGDRTQLPVPPPGLAPGTEYVLGTIGGGGDGSDVLVATAHAAVRSGVAAVLCTGPLMATAERERVVAATEGLPSVVVVDHLREPAAVAAGARCVVTRGGYNSLCELVRGGVPTIVVPRVWPRREQLLRAEAFESRGLVSRVDEDGPDLEGRLAEAVAALTVRRPSSGVRLDLDGRRRVATALRRVAGEQATSLDDPVVESAKVPA
jgi:predicted glycosyltransferase